MNLKMSKIRITFLILQLINYQLLLEALPRISIHSSDSSNSRQKPPKYSRHHQYFGRIGKPPLARFDDYETESGTSDDFPPISSYGHERFNSYARDNLIRSHDDYRRALHEQQLMAIRVSFVIVMSFLNYN